MESLSGTAVSSTVAIVGSIWPKGPAQAGPVIQAQCFDGHYLHKEHPSSRIRVHLVPRTTLMGLCGTPKMNV